jgi:hypothetical protein
MISSDQCHFCFVVSYFDYTKLLARFGPVFQAAANRMSLRFLPGWVRRRIQVKVYADVTFTAVVAGT